MDTRFNIFAGARLRPLMGLLFLCATWSSALAQSMSHDVISSGGDHYSAGGLHVSFTMGEPLTETYLTANDEVTQGFHQLYMQRNAVFDTICEGESSEGYTVSGVYEDIFIGADGLDSIRTLHLTVNPAIALSAQVTDAVCPGSTNGFINLTVAGGSAPFDFAWSNGALTEDLNNVGAGIYDVSVIDVNGCENSITGLQVQETFMFPAVPTSIQGNTNFCATNQAVFSVQPVPDASNYTWTLPAGWSGSSNAAVINAVAGPVGGTVSVTASNICGTSAPQTLVVTSNPIYSSLQGSVTFNGNPVTSGWVYTYTEILEATGYQKADSVPIFNGQYNFPTLPLYPASFILQAVAGSSFVGAVPTFYAVQGMSHQWDNPNLTYSLFSVCGQSQVRNIQVIVEEAQLEEPGFCTLKGQVRWMGEQKMAEDPIPLIDVVVERVPPGASAYGIQQTDEEGFYEFENIPAVPSSGFFYRIYVSIPGIPMSDTYSIIVTSSDTLIDNLDFVVDTIANIIYPIGDSTLISVSSISSLGSLLLMPNPMYDEMTVMLPPNFVGQYYRIINAGGILQREGQLPPGQQTVFSIARQQLSTGLHIIEVFSDDGKRLSARFLTR